MDRGRVIALVVLVQPDVVMVCKLFGESLVHFHILEWIVVSVLTTVPGQSAQESRQVTALSLHLARVLDHKVDCGVLVLRFRDGRPLLKEDVDPFVLVALEGPFDLLDDLVLG